MHSQSMPDRRSQNEYQRVPEALYDLEKMAD